jgi:hypothetical protein
MKFKFDFQLRLHNLFGIFFLMFYGNKNPPYIRLILKIVTLRFAINLKETIYCLKDN